MTGQDHVIYKRCGCLDPASGRQLGKKCPLLPAERHGSWYYATHIDGLGGRRERVRRGGFATAADAQQVGHALLA